MFTVLWPNRRVNHVDRWRVAVTVIESFAVRLVVTVYVTVSPFWPLLAYWVAAVALAALADTGSRLAPASAAASAAACTDRLAWYQEPTSIASAQAPSSTIMKTV